MKCPNCGGEVSDAGGRCPACKTLLPASVATGILTPVPGDDAATVFSSPIPPPKSFPDDADTTGLPPSAGGVRHASSPKSVIGPLTIGQQFGSRYHILRQLGIGGMGAVYQAWDSELEVAVALKVIRPEVTRIPTAAQDIERRFKQELLLARQVTHKNVVRIHDLGEIDGIKYITMPYIEGADLATVLRDEKLPVAKSDGDCQADRRRPAGRARRGRRASRSQARQRDDRADDHAIIMDFGIARSTSRVGLDAGDAPAPRTGSARRRRWRRRHAVAATVAGEVVGTIEYMAPEQARGEHVDQRADIYAFGLIVYDMLDRPAPRPSTRSAPSASCRSAWRRRRPRCDHRSGGSRSPRRSWSHAASSQMPRSAIRRRRSWSRPSIGSTTTASCDRRSASSACRSRSPPRRCFWRCRVTSGGPRGRRSSTIRCRSSSPTFRTTRRIRRSTARSSRCSSARWKARASSARTTATASGARWARSRQSDSTRPRRAELPSSRDLAWSSPARSVRKAAAIESRSRRRRP